VYLCGWRLEIYKNAFPVSHAVDDCVVGDGRYKWERKRTEKRRNEEGKATRDEGMWEQ